MGEFTGFPEILDGRVKTLHPRIHGGILARRDMSAHRREMAEHHLEPIDLVVVNFYPFERVVENPDTSLEVAVENIDIGGPALVRAAAKNYAHVAVVVDSADYAALIEELDRTGGMISAATRWRLARKAFDAGGRVRLRDCQSSGSDRGGAARAAGRELQYHAEPRAGTALRRKSPSAGGALRRLSSRSPSSSMAASCRSTTSWTSTGRST